MSLLEKILPYFEMFRGWLDVPANWLAKALELDPVRATWIVYGLVAWLIAKQIFKVFYVDTQGRMDKFLILAAGIFVAIKFIG